MTREELSPIPWEPVTVQSLIPQPEVRELPHHIGMRWFIDAWLQLDRITKSGHELLQQQKREKQLLQRIKN